MYILPKQDVQHRSARGPLRLPVVAETLNLMMLPDYKRETVMRRVPVLLPHGRNERGRLILVLHGAHRRDETRLLFDQFPFAALVNNLHLFHQRTVLPSV